MTDRAPCTVALVPADEQQPITEHRVHEGALGVDLSSEDLYERVRISESGLELLCGRSGPNAHGPRNDRAMRLVNAYVPTFFTDDLDWYAGGPAVVLYYDIDLDINDDDEDGRLDVDMALVHRGAGSGRPLFEDD